MNYNNGITAEIGSCFLVRRRGEIARRKWACTRGTSLCCSVSCQQLRLETPTAGKQWKAMYADMWQSLYIRLPRGRGAGPTAYIYTSRVVMVKPDQCLAGPFVGSSLCCQNATWPQLETYVDSNTYSTSQKKVNNGNGRVKVAVLPRYNSGTLEVRVRYFDGSSSVLYRYFCDTERYSEGYPSNGRSIYTSRQSSRITQPSICRHSERRGNTQPTPPRHRRYLQSSVMTAMGQ